MLTRREALGSIAASPVALTALATAAPPAASSSNAVARAVAIASTLIAPNAPPDEVARDESPWAKWCFVLRRSS